jgi:hypothetical protein
VRDGTLSLTPAELETVRTKFNRALRLERKRFKQLAKEIGAAPTLRGGGQDEAPASDDSQSA